MHLLEKLRWPWAFSVGGAGLSLAATIAIVWFAGAIEFANYGIDLAKLAVVGLLLEFVPSPYAIIRAQRDDALRHDLSTFALVGGGLMIMCTALLAALGAFRGFSGWMLVYVGYLSLQRYFDVKLQAEGRLQEFVQITFGAALLRLVLLLGALLFLPRQASADVIWGSLALGSLGSLGCWLLVRPTEASPFFRLDHAVSSVRLIRAHRAYRPYYANVALKRFRDAAMPLLCGVLAVDGVQVARYLLAYRGVDFVCGQLRLIEAMLANLSTRQQVGSTRGRQLTQLGILGQCIAFASSVLLAGQTGLDSEVVLLSFVASLLIYPYVFDIGRRSDAYAEEKPGRVTVSLAAHVTALLLTMAALAIPGLMIAPMLVLAPLMGQLAAALAYALRKEPQRGA